MRQPKRKAIEPGIYIRVNEAGERVGDTFEIAWKDAHRRSQRRGGFRTISDARDHLHKAKARRVDRVREPARTRLTFAAVAEQWTQAHVAGLRPATQAVYGAALRHLLPEFGRRRMTSITKAHVKAYIAKKSDLAGWTVASHLTALSGVFTFAIDELGLPGPSPTAGLRRGDRPKRARGGMRIVNDDELGRLLELAPDDHRLYLALLAQTGMRKSEALGLVWEDVGQDTLRVRYQRDRRTGGRVELKNSESQLSDARRTVVVTAGLIAALREHRIASPRAQGFDYVFAGTDYHAVDRAWAKTRDAAGFGKVEHDGRVVQQAMRLHDLRHSHVSSLIAEGWDVARIAARIGDTIATVQQVYAHLFDSARYAEAERASLTARYDAIGRDGTQNGRGMAPTDGVSRQQPLTAPMPEPADLQAKRGRRP